MYLNVFNVIWVKKSFNTDLQQSSSLEFVEKEGKWFSFIKGEFTTLNNLDTSEFTVQGIGVASTVSGTGEDNKGDFIIANNVSDSYGSPDWDDGADGNN